MKYNYQVLGIQVSFGQVQLVPPEKKRAQRRRKIMIKNLYELCLIADRFVEYLDGKVEFSEDGFPVFRKEMFLDEEPDLIVPFYNRNNKIVADRAKTVLCFFSSDSDLYRRLENVFDDLDEYKKCMGVIGLDITVTDDMDPEWQNMIMLVNQLFFGNLVMLAINKQF